MVFCIYLAVCVFIFFPSLLFMVKYGNKKKLTVMEILMLLFWSIVPVINALIFVISWILFFAFNIADKEVF